MTRFMCIHTLPAHGMTREQVERVAQAAQNDPIVRGYRSFCNLSEGKLLCVMDAPDRESLVQWFNHMSIPFDSVTAVELEGERGTICEATAMGAPPVGAGL